MVKISHLDLALAVVAPRAFNRVGWGWELKYDGFRLLATNVEGQIRMFSRKGTDLSAAFPELVAELRTLRGRFALDCELVVLDHLGNPHFERLAVRARMTKTATIETASKRDPATLFAFDALVLNGKDLRELPLKKRKERLLKFLQKGKRVRYLHYVPERGETLYEQAVQVDFEGVVGKKTDGAYWPGRASGWIKVKTPSGQERQRERAEQFYEPPKKPANISGRTPVG